MAARFSSLLLLPQIAGETAETCTDSIASQFQSRCGWAEIVELKKKKKHLVSKIMKMEELGSWIITLYNCLSTVQILSPCWLINGK